jgi:hypothetical protein
VEAGHRTVIQVMQAKARRVEQGGSQAVGSEPADLIFACADGKAWASSTNNALPLKPQKQQNWGRPASFRILRHTYASALAMKGVQWERRHAASTQETKAAFRSERP